MSRPSCLYTACRSCAYASLVLAAPFTFFFGVGIAGGGAASGSVDESFSATVLGAVLVRSSDLPGSWRSLEFSSESELENDPFTNNSSTAPRTTIAHGPIPEDVTLLQLFETRAESNSQTRPNITTAGMRTNFRNSAKAANAAAKRVPANRSNPRNTPTAIISMRIITGDSSVGGGNKKWWCQGTVGRSDPSNLLG